MHTSPSLARLDHLAVLRLTGPDRVALVQGQASNDATRVDAAHAQLTSFSTPKGRLLAIGVLLALGDEHLLITEASVAASLAKRLAMYVLRSKAKVELATEAFTLFGLIGAGESKALASVGLALPAHDWDAAPVTDGTVIRIPQARALIVASRGAGDSLLAELTLHAKPVAADAWRLADIQAGLPSIVATTSEHFVPLWLGLDAIGAVDFRKGCYTGQEIVARTHYLGSVKQQLYRATAPSSVEPGTKLYAEGGTQSVGEVVSAAADGSAFQVLAALRTDAATAGVRIGSAAGPALDGVSAVR